MVSRRIRGEQVRRVPASVMALAFVFIAGLGYIAGTFHMQIIGAVAPVFGIKVETGSLNLSSVQDTYRTLKDHYDGTIDDDKLIEGANKGLVEAIGDQYTIYMNKSESEAFNNELTGNIGGGIGVELGLRSDVVTVVRILKDNPAEKVGLVNGDAILKINDESTEGMSTNDAATKIRGESGTTVKLTILRGSDTKEFTLTRAVINNPSVYTSVDYGIGVMTISRFDDQTGSLARAAAADFKSKGVKGVVLDLRGNGGGYVTAAQEVASLWLDKKIVVSERKNGTVVDELMTSSNPVLGGIPTVVLVNGSSASASEIVAGALHDYKVAKLVGTKTFGKGSVQQLITLPSGAELKVTIARWYTPNGSNISQQGIAPDTTVGIEAADITAGRDPQLDAAKGQLNQ